VDGLTLRGRTALVASLLGAALVAWIVAVQRMRGMDMGPGTDLGTLGWFVGIWVTMIAAMMLPSAAPAVLLFARVRRAAQAWVFVAGYLLAWTAYGLVAYGVYRAIRATWTPPVWVAGVAIAVAGLYQLTPLKTACLRHCRSPIGLLLRARGALRLGVEHGAYCVGCCTGLMLALFALGVMSIFWMAVVALAILVEKALPGGERFARVLAVALVVLGISVAVT
jgi:predicted metal-binding membrane protein